MTGNKASTIVIPTIKYGAALILMISGVFLSIKLISVHIVGEWTFCFLILSSILVGVLAFLSDRLKEVVFGFKEWRLVLSEIEIKEKKILLISEVIAELAASDAALSGLMWEPIEKKNWIRGKIKKIEEIAGMSLRGDFIDYIKSPVSFLDPKSDEYKTEFEKLFKTLKQ